MHLFDLVAEIVIMAYSACIVCLFLKIKYILLYTYDNIQVQIIKNIFMF